MTIRIAIVSILLLTAAPALATPYCHQCPFDCNDLDLGHKDCSIVDGARGSCCVDLTQKGLDRAHDFDRRGRDYDRRPAPPPVAEHCPSGFQPSENKCSAEERRRGCKDMRLPGGLGCVHR